MNKRTVHRTAKTLVILVVIAGIAVAIWRTLPLDRAIVGHVDNNNIVRVQEYFEGGGDPNLSTWIYDGGVSGHRSLLYRAVKNRSNDIVTLLLSHGASIVYSSASGHPGLEAVYQDSGDIAGILIDAGMNPNEPCGEGNSMWNEALLCQRWSAAAAIAIRKVEPVDWRVQLRGARWGAPSPSRREFVAVMLKKGLSADTIIDGETILEMTNRTGDKDLVDLCSKSSSQKQ